MEICRVKSTCGDVEIYKDNIGQKIRNFIFSVTELNIAHDFPFQWITENNYTC